MDVLTHLQNMELVRSSTKGTFLGGKLPWVENISAADVQKLSCSFHPVPSLCLFVSQFANSRAILWAEVGAHVDRAGLIGNCAAYFSPKFSIYLAGCSFPTLSSCRETKYTFHSLSVTQLSLINAVVCADEGADAYFSTLLDRESEKYSCSEGIEGDLPFWRRASKNAHGVHVDACGNTLYSPFFPVGSLRNIPDIKRSWCCSLLRRAMRRVSWLWFLVKEAKIRTSKGIKEGGQGRRSVSVLFFYFGPCLVVVVYHFTVKYFFVQFRRTFFSHRKCRQGCDNHWCDRKKDFPALEGSSPFWLLEEVLLRNIAVVGFFLEYMTH